MRSGNLRNSVIIQTPTESFDSNGELISTWATFSTVWASIEPLTGREFWAARTVNAEMIGKIRLRYINGITPKMRVLFGIRYFNINTIINTDEKNIELILLVTEVA